MALDPIVSLAVAIAERPGSFAFLIGSGAGADEAHGRMLVGACREHALALLERTDPPLDYPVAGLALFAIGAWGVLREAVPVDDAVALLVLAERFAYNRAVPTVAWERVEAVAEELAPGRIAASRATWTPGARPRG